MKIKISDVEKVEQAIREAEGRATARTVTVQEIQKVLGGISIHIPKRHLDGTVVEWDGGEHFPKAYRYRPESTHWKAENVRGTWYLTDVFRGTCPNRTGYKGKITYSEAAKEYLLAEASKLWR